MTREEAITILNMVEAHGSLVIQAKDMAIKALEYDDAKYHEEHGEVVVDKAVWEDAKRALEQEPNMTWVTGADGAKIAFWDVPVWKVTKICEILGEPQESEVNNG